MGALTNFLWTPFYFELHGERLERVQFECEELMQRPLIVLLSPILRYYSNTGMW